MSVVSAPGKLILLGDYAVLDGGLALVAAVDRRASGRATPPASGASGDTGAAAWRTPVVDAVIARAAVEGHALEGSLEIDTRAFFDASGKKMGLGSSAATAVVAAALVSGRGDEAALQIAIDGHRDASGGEGSGIDVAASFYGGVIAARRQPGPVAPLPTRLKDLRLAVLFTKKSARTAELVQACRASPAWNDWIGVLCALADEGARAWEKQDARAFLSVVQRYGRAMAGLGRAAKVDIVTEELDAIMRLAEEQGGAAKPSGAGGGDVAIVWGVDAELGPRIAERTATELVALAIDPRGLSRR